MLFSSLVNFPSHHLWPLSRVPSLQIPSSQCANKSLHKTFSLSGSKLLPCEWGTKVRSYLGNFRILCQNLIYQNQICDAHVWMEIILAQWYLPFKHHRYKNTNVKYSKMKDKLGNKFLWSWQQKFYIQIGCLRGIEFYTRWKEFDTKLCDLILLSIKWLSEAYIETLASCKS